MRELPLVGVCIPASGPHVSPRTLKSLATAVESFGYHSVAVAQQPLEAGEPVWDDEELPDGPTYDTIGLLTWVAAKTETVRLRTDVPFPLTDEPVTVIQRIATLDHLSGHRVDVGYVLRCRPDDVALPGMAPDEQWRRYEDYVKNVLVRWGPWDLGGSGSGGPVPSGDGAGATGDGLTITFVDWDDTAAKIRWYRELGGAGPVVLQAGPPPVEAVDLGARHPWAEQSVYDDLLRAKECGVQEVDWDMNRAGWGPDRQVTALRDLAERLAP